MKITLLRPLPDPTRWSMDLYSQRLKEAMQPLLQPGESIEMFPGERHDLQKVGVGKFKRYLQHYIEYGKAVSAMTSDIFHITDHGYANLVPATGKAKVVVTFHDALLPRLGRGDIPVTHKPLKTILAQKYALKCMKKADFVITDSEFSRKEFLEFCSFDEAKTCVAHLGIKNIDQGGQSFEALQRKWGLEGKKVLLTVGRTDAHKNMEGTLRVLQKLVFEKGQNVVLLKVGSDFTLSQKKQIEETGLKDYVRTPGVLSERDLTAAYHLSDVLLFLSWYEGFGFPALEAMRADLPVVVSNRGSLPEVVGDAAIVVDPKDEEKVVSEVASLLGSSDRTNDFIQRGRKRMQEFSWRKTAEATLAVYRQIYNQELK